MRRALGVVIALAGLTASSQARATGDEVALGQEAPVIRSHRTFGFGIGAGAGLQIFLGGTSGISPSVPILLPAIELQFFPFRRRDWSLDVSIPLWNTIITAAKDDALFLQADTYLDFNVGKGNTRLVVGPGLGVAYRDTGGTSTSISGSIRIPFEIGPEFLVSKKHVGIRILARPFSELVFAKRDGGLVNGIFAVLVVTGYTTRVSLSEAEPD